MPKCKVCAYETDCKDCMKIHKCSTEPAEGHNCILTLLADEGFITRFREELATDIILTFPDCKKVLTPSINDFEKALRKAVGLPADKSKKANAFSEAGGLEERK
jgi:hypothetical protein